MPSLFTNLAACHAYCDGLDQAAEAVEKAIAANAEYGPAFHCRAWIELRNPLSRRSLHETLGDLEHAIEKGPESGQLYANAACVCARIGIAEPPFRSRALDYLEKGWKLGLNISLAASNPDLSVLHDEPSFRELLDRPRVAENRYATDWFSDPLPRE